MSKKQIILLSLIVCLPLVALVWLGARIARDEQTVREQRLRDLLAQQLAETNQSIERFFTRQQQILFNLIDVPASDTSHLREIIRQQPIISQLFVLESDGRLLHPAVNAPLNQSEREFLDRARVFLIDKDLIRAAGNTEETSGRATPQGTRTVRPTLIEQTASRTHGWYVWYWGRGVNLVFWRRLADGRIAGAELERSRWIADLISSLPQTAPNETHTTSSRIGLFDSSDSTIYQWGLFEPPGDTAAFVELAVCEPLASWRLKYYVSDESDGQFATGGTLLNLLAGLIAVAVALTGLAFYFYRESSRDMREAATRVNFVNQVSHELKSPLTNIRMYAELLENDLNSEGSGEAQRHQQRLDVIVTESRRLSRLIGNVLTLARHQRQEVKLKPRPGQVDAVIRNVIAQFQPTMHSKGVELEFEGLAQSTVELDADVLEQILGNLLSNVEKYAAGGRYAKISSCQTGEISTIVVADRGPGVPATDRSNVFDPFYRVSDRLDSPAGAGIGLSIARDLARLHGGDVVLLDDEGGATFQVTLRTPTISRIE